MKKLLVFFVAMLFTPQMSVAVSDSYKINIVINLDCDYQNTADKRSCELRSPSTSPTALTRNQCPKISGDPFDDNGVIYIQASDVCDELKTAITRSKCPYVEQLC